jgi:hypothetical protein
MRDLRDRRWSALMVMGSIVNHWLKRIEPGRHIPHPTYHST